MLAAIQLVILVCVLPVTGHPCVTEVPKEHYYPEKHCPELQMIDGHRVFFLTADRAFASDRPWVWFAPVFLTIYAQPPNDDIRWIFQNLLDNGISVAGIDVDESYGSPRGSKAYSAFYDSVVRIRGWSKRPCLLAQSRGGLMLYNWAISNPSLVACIAGIYPAVNLRNWPPMGEQSFQAAAREYVPLTPDTFSKRLSEFNPIEHLQPLVASHVPIFNIHGCDDDKVDYAQNSKKLTGDYKALGGQAELVTLEGKEHGHVRHDPKLFESKELLKFLVTHAVGR